VSGSATVVSRESAFLHTVLKVTPSVFTTVRRWDGRTDGLICLSAIIICSKAQYLWSSWTSCSRKRWGYVMYSN